MSPNYTGLSVDKTEVENKPYKLIASRQQTSKLQAIAKICICFLLTGTRPGLAFASALVWGARSASPHPTADIRSSICTATLGGVATLGLHVSIRFHIGACTSCCVVVVLQVRRGEAYSAFGQISCT